MLGFCVAADQSPSELVSFLHYLVQDFNRSPWWYRMFTTPDPDSNRSYLICWGNASSMNAFRDLVIGYFGSPNDGPADLHWFLNPGGAVDTVYRFYWFRIVMAPESFAFYRMVSPSQRMPPLRGPLPRRVYYVFQRRLERYTTFPRVYDNEEARRHLSQVLRRAYFYFDNPGRQLSVPRVPG